MLALVSMTHSITILPDSRFLTAIEIEILSVCTSMPDIFNAGHKRVLLPEKFEQGTQNLLQRGALL